MSAQHLTKLFDFRGFIASSVAREFRSRYTNSILGSAWAVIQPLAMVFIYTVIFSQVMRAKFSGLDTEFAYSIYLCSGVLTWGFFSEIITRSQTMFVENSNIIKKLNFPKSCIPTIVIVNATINFAIIFSLFLAALVLIGHFPGIKAFALIPLLAVLLIFAVGMGVITGILNVFFRDVGQFMGIFMQFWFWFTPIVYPSEIVPEEIRSLQLLLNPLAPLIEAFQAVLLYGKWPNWAGLAPTIGISLLLCYISVRTFRNLSADLVDEL